MNGYSRHTYYRVRYGNGNAYIAKVKSTSFPVAEEYADYEEEYFQKFGEAKAWLLERTSRALEDAKSMHRHAKSHKKLALRWE